MSARLSLWLLPPAGDSAINLKLQKLIHRSIPLLFPYESFPKFDPHITLATGIDSSFYEPRRPQEWLDNLDLTFDPPEDEPILEENARIMKECKPMTKEKQLNVEENQRMLKEKLKVRSEDVQIVLTGVETGDTFTKKCYLQVEKSERLVKFETLLQKRIFERDEALGAKVSEGTKETPEASKISEAARVAESWDPHLSLLYWIGDIAPGDFGKIKEVVIRSGFNLTAGKPAWSGGRIQLVDTSKPVEQWEVLAERLIE